MYFLLQRSHHLIGHMSWEPEWKIQFLQDESTFEPSACMGSSFLSPFKIFPAFSLTWYLAYLGSCVFFIRSKLFLYLSKDNLLCFPYLLLF